MVQMPSALPSGLLLLRDLIMWCYNATLAGIPIYLVLQQSQGLNLVSISEPLFLRKKREEGEEREYFGVLS